MEVPPDGTNLSQHVEFYFNESSIVDYYCEECEVHSQAEKKLMLKSVNETNFIIIILRRSVLGADGNLIVANKINAVLDIHLM